jgi:phage-related minor tail protein
VALNFPLAIGISANVQGTQQVDRLTDSLKRMGQQGDTSARQINNAMRQLPAQFQDVAVSLAGGQNPLMVLLQQGSQITTSFGGIGNAIRGIGSVITPAVGGFALLAGAIGGVGAAFIAGYKESREFSRTLALTGNFAGITADNYERMAEAIAATTQASMSNARGFLSAAVGTGDIGPGAVRSVATAMGNIQRLTGATRDEVVKMFDGLTDSASDWAVKTNRNFNFLSREQFAYIRQLEEQGRNDEAIKFAADALNDSLATRQVRLGSLERAWNSLTSAIGSALDKMKSIGRVETVGEELAGLQARLDSARFMQQRMTQRGQIAPGASPEMLRLQGQIDALNEMMGLEEQQAAIRAAIAADNKRGIDEEKKAEEERKKAAQEEAARAKQRADMLQKVRDEITKLTVGELGYQLLLADRLGMTDDEIAHYRSLLNAVSALRDQERLGEEERKRAADAQKLRDEESRRLVMDRMKLEAEGRQVTEQNRTPLEKYNDELDRMQSLLQRNVITYDTYIRSVQKASEEFSGAAKEQKNLLRELTQALEGWGKQSASAFADFAMGVKTSFKDMARSVIKDIITMVSYQTLMKPLFSMLGAALTPAPTDISTLRAIPGLAMGGVMSSSGLQPLKRYARGGIANSPQLAVFGEGSMPEAYVPLPDGRSIPVTMQGGGSTSVVVNVSVDGGAPQVQNDQGAGQLGRLIAGAVKAELINQRRPGGILAAA